MKKEIEVTKYFNIMFLDRILSMHYHEIEYRQLVGNGPGKTKLYIYKDDSNQHHLPHVHVINPRGDFVVSLEDCSLIKGELKGNGRKFFMKYFKDNKEKFIQVWNELN
ncbi:DUF4160 domain-containing protein [Mycoplasmatota bacterium WC30]